MNIRTKYIGLLAALSIVDAIIPIPVIGIILIYVVLQRPPWFKNTVSQIYQAN